MKIKVNPDKEYANEIRRKLKENDGYCPCKITKNEDTLCLCKEFREGPIGWCHCELYYKEED